MQSGSEKSKKSLIIKRSLNQMTVPTYVVKRVYAVFRVQLYYYGFTYFPYKSTRKLSVVILLHRIAVNCISVQQLW